MKLGVVGAGNMARALVEGFVKAGMPTDVILASAASDATCKNFHRATGVCCLTDNQSIAEFAEVLLLCVKPYHMDDALAAVTPYVKPGTLIISIASGLTLAYYQEKFGETATIIRAMPNLPTRIQRGITSLLPNAQVTEVQKTTAAGLFSAVGEVVWLDDETVAFDAFLSAAGSGPAFVMHLMQQFVTYLTEHSFSDDQARQIVISLFSGTAALVNSTDESLETLISQVKSKGGTTEAGIHAFIESHLDETLQKGLQAAFDRAKELA